MISTHPPRGAPPRRRRRRRADCDGTARIVG
jgi:hypothetical protein